MALVDALLLDPYPINVWLARRSDGVAGSGTVNDPYKASTQPQFDSRMAEYQNVANVTIYLGPGTFETKGFDGTNNFGAWQGPSRRDHLAAGTGD